MEELITKYIAHNDTMINSLEGSMLNLENQVGQLASAINNRPQGALPSDTEVNPRREMAKSSVRLSQSVVVRSYR